MTHDVLDVGMLEVEGRIADPYAARSTPRSRDLLGVADDRQSLGNVRFRFRSFTWLSMAIRDIRRQTMPGSYGPAAD